MTWTESINRAALKGASVITKNFQAMQSIPAQHRLFNAGVMGLGWLGGNWLREIVFAQKHDGTEVKREDVPAPLRFMHGLVDLNQSDDDAGNRWKKLAYQMFPAVGSAFGAYYGSQIAFERHPHREQDYAKWKKKDSLNIFEADNAVAYAISKPLRALAATFGVFSAASGLTAAYGALLGVAFATSSNRTIFPGIVKGAFGPAQAVGRHVSNLSKYVRQAANSGGAISEEWAAEFARDVIKPMFPGKSEEEIRKGIQGIVQEVYQKAASSGLSGHKMEEAVHHEMHHLMGAARFPQMLVRLGFKADDIRNANLGNGIPWLKWPVAKIQEAFESITGHKGQLKLFQERFAKGIT